MQNSRSLHRKTEQKDEAGSSQPREQDPSRTITREPQSTSSDSRHTTNPPVRRLGRSFLADNICKEPRVRGAPATAPSSGRFWHGFAVRRPLLGGGGGASTFGLHVVRRKDLESDPVQKAPAPDEECMRSKAPGPAFFTERSLAAYLSVSDRTIRNWIRRGELPSYFPRKK